VDLFALLKKIKDNFAYGYDISQERLKVFTSDKGHANSFAYLAVSSLISALVFFVFTAITNPSLLGGVSDAFIFFLISLFIAIICMVLYYVVFGVVYLFLRLIGVKTDYARTMQIAIYSSTPFIIFGTIPYNTGLLMGAISLIQMTISANKVYNWKAAVAFFLVPVVLSVGLHMMVVK